MNETCAVPDCNTPSAHAHHLWPRSFLRKQPFEWVEIDGVIIGNRVGLCRKHHAEVTGQVGGYRARISFSQGLFWWEQRVWDNGDGHESWWQRHTHPLTDQPPGVKTLGAERTGRSSAPEAPCPTCGHQRKPVEKRPRRPSKTWVVNVPSDAEVGSDVLDDWIEDLSTLLGFNDQTSRLKRYHALCVLFAWWGQNRQAFARDVTEAQRS